MTLDATPYEVVCGVGAVQRSLPSRFGTRTSLGGASNMHYGLCLMHRVVGR